MTDKAKKKDADLSRLATEPIPIMTEDESAATTARDFNVTSGAERSGSESDTEVDTGTDDIGSTPTRRSKSRGKASRSSSGRKKAKSDIAKTDADTPVEPTDESKGTSAKSGTESVPTSESKGTSAKSEVF